jgi:hypothetical protein
MITTLKEWQKFKLNESNITANSDILKNIKKR